MKVLFRWGVVIALGLVGVLGAVWMYVGIYAVPIFNEKISALLHRKTSIRSIYLSFPLSVMGKGLEIEGLGTVGKFQAEFDWLGLFRRNVDIVSLGIYDPVMVGGPGDGGDFRGPLFQGDSSRQEAIPGASRASAIAVPKILIRRVTIYNGTLHFKSKDGKTLTLGKVDAQLTNISLPGMSGQTDFLATASLVDFKIPFVSGVVKAGGWFNWAARDMDATIEVVRDDGLARLHARLVSSKNDLQVTGKVLLAGGQAPRMKDEEAGVVENVVWDLLEASQTDIDADFSFQTTMDRFEIGPISLKGNMTTGLNSSETSATIVQSLKTIGEQFLKEEQPLDGE
ncbi:MAG: hypothetical protein HQL21_04825 [Candidatus Omnitrophica bacterium]|nr:hypothetical protein [Candidatus Omnitrophota bacterium]